MEMGIVTFSVGTKHFKFKKPLMLKVEYVDGGVCLTHEDLSLSACGTSFSECDAIIREELAMIWEDYVLAPDDVLAPSGIALKNKLLGMVEEAKQKNEILH